MAPSISRAPARRGLRRSRRRWPSVWSPIVTSGSPRCSGLGVGEEALGHPDLEERAGRVQAAQRAHDLGGVRPGAVVERERDLALALAGDGDVGQAGEPVALREDVRPAREPRRGRRVGRAAAARDHDDADREGEHEQTERDDPVPASPQAPPVASPSQQALPGVRPTLVHRVRARLTRGSRCGTRCTASVTPSGQCERERTAAVPLAHHDVRDPGAQVVGDRPARDRLVDAPAAGERRRRRQAAAERSSAAARSGSGRRRRGRR